MKTETRAKVEALIEKEDDSRFMAGKSYSFIEGASLLLDSWVEMYEALENIKKHQSLIMKGFKQTSPTYFISDKALTNAKKLLGEK